MTNGTRPARTIDEDDPFIQRPRNAILLPSHRQQNLTDSRYTSAAFATARGENATTLWSESSATAVNSSPREPDYSPSFRSPPPPYSGAPATASHRAAQDFRTPPNGNRPSRSLSTPYTTSPSRDAAEGTQEKLRRHFASVNFNARDNPSSPCPVPHPNLRGRAISLRNLGVADRDIDAEEHKSVLMCEATPQLRSFSLGCYGPTQSTRCQLDSPGHLPILDFFIRLPPGHREATAVDNVQGEMKDEADVIMVDAQMISQGTKRALPRSSSSPIAPSHPASHPSFFNPRLVGSSPSNAPPTRHTSRLKKRRLTSDP